MNKKLIALAAVGTLVAIFFLASSALVWSQENIFNEKPFLIKGLRPIGMGGAFVGIANDENAIYYNPAGLAEFKSFHLSLLLNANLGIDGATVNIITDGIAAIPAFTGVTTGNLSESDQEALNTFLGSAQKVNSAFDFSDQVLTLAFENFGLNLLSIDAEIGFGVKEGNLIPNDSLDFDDKFFTTFKLDVGTAIALSFGNDSFGIENTDIGMTVRAFVRNKTSVSAGLFNALGLVTGGDIESLLGDILPSEDNRIGVGGALDVGGIYFWDDFINEDFGRVSTGVVFRNFPVAPIFWVVDTAELATQGLGASATGAATSTGASTLSPVTFIPPDLSVGAAWWVPFEIPFLFEDFVVAYDLTDIIWNYPVRGEGDFPNLWDGLWMKTHIGTEFKTLFKLLSLRAGINQGYPALGTGLNLGVLSVDAAFSGFERGLFPGADPIFKFLFNVSLGWKG